MWSLGEKRRDEAAFGKELRNAVPRLRRYAIAMAGNVAVADDLVQDCLERAWRSRDGLTSTEVPFFWLRAILHNVHIDWRRRRRHETNLVEIETVADDLAVSTSPDPLSGTDLLQALQRLNPDHRRILVLAGIEGLSYQEVANELSIPLGTVMSRLARARSTLRGLLDAGGASAGNMLNPKVSQ